MVNLIVTLLISEYGSISRVSYKFYSIAVNYKIILRLTKKEFRAKQVTEMKGRASRHNLSVVSRCWRRCIVLREVQPPGSADLCSLIERQSLSARRANAFSSGRNQISTNNSAKRKIKYCCIISDPVYFTTADIPPVHIFSSYCYT